MRIELNISSKGELISPKKLRGILIQDLEM